MIPGCSSGPDGSCPLNRFKQLIYDAISPECSVTVNAAVLLPPSPVPPSPSTDPDGGLGFTTTAYVLLGIAVVFGIVMVVLGVVTYQALYCDNTKTNRELYKPLNI